MKNFYLKEFILFRSFDRIILNILSFWKRLVVLDKRWKNHEKHKNVAKIYHQNETEILSPNPWKKFLVFDNFGSKTNILAYLVFGQKQLILQNDPFLRWKWILSLKRGSLLSDFNFIMLILDLLYISTHIRLNLKTQLLAWERGFIHQKEADGPSFCPYNI